MFETYDTNQLAYVEHSGEYYDLNLKAWVPVNSAMTYDKTERAWIERLYVDYFVLQTKNLQSGDIFELKNSGISLRTFSTGKSRGVSFYLPYKWKVTDVVEFDVFTNALGQLSVGHHFHYNNGWTVSGGGPHFVGNTDQHYTWNLNSLCPDTYEGYPTYDYGFHVSISLGSDDTTGETYSEIKNFTLNGKKIGFKE